MDRHRRGRRLFGGKAIYSARLDKEREGHSGKEDWKAVEIQML